MNFIVRAVASYGVARLKEASTYRSAILLVGGSWAATNPSQVDMLIPICLALAGFVGSFFPDLFGKPVNAPTDPPVLPPIELVSRPESIDSASPRLYEPVVPSRVDAKVQAELFGSGWGG